MTIEQLREVVSARPFRSFTLQLADGTTVPVPHPDFILPHPSTGRTLAVATRRGTFKIIDLLLVAAIEVGDVRPNRRGRR